MLIARAYAAAESATGETMAALPDAPSATEAFLWNMGLIILLVFMFYVLLIMPQQRRMKEHTKMLDSLKKGDKVITGGGLVGKIDKVTGESDEVVVDLGGGVKVTALRSTIHAKDDPLMRRKPANDQAKGDREKK